MAIELMNCKGIFSQDCIDDIKENINDYHQGFMVVNDELYLPRYKVVLLGFEYGDDTEYIVLDDYNKATAKDKLAQLFNDNDYITNNKLIDLAEFVWTNNLEYTLDYVIDLCHANYWKGYEDGFKA